MPPHRTCADYSSAVPWITSFGGYIGTNASRRLYLVSIPAVFFVLFCFFYIHLSPRGRIGQKAQAAYI